MHYRFSTFAIPTSPLRATGFWPSCAPKDRSAAWSQALRDKEKAGVKVPLGCVVAPVVSSANHDEAIFENPEVFDVRRTIPRVLSMSSGNHQCIGQPLA